MQKRSEQSARMVSMKNATDNAESLIKDLKLEYNKLRQGNITKELLEIAGGQAEGSRICALTGLTYEYRQNCSRYSVRWWTLNFPGRCPASTTR